MRTCDPNFHVVTQRGQEVHQALDRECSWSIAHQERHVRLLDAKDLARLALRQAAGFDNPIDLERQVGLEQLLFRLGNPRSAKILPLPSS